MSPHALFGFSSSCLGAQLHQAMPWLLNKRLNGSLGCKEDRRSTQVLYYLKPIICLFPSLEPCCISRVSMRWICLCNPKAKRPSAVVRESRCLCPMDTTSSGALSPISRPYQGILGDYDKCQVFWLAR